MHSLSITCNQLLLINHFPPNLFLSTTFYGAGVMAEAMGVEVEDVASDGAGLAFIVYPEAVTTMPFSPAW